MTSRFRAPVAALLFAALALTGCGEPGSPVTGPSITGPTGTSASAAADRPGEPWFDEIKAAASGGKVSSGCGDLPVDFEVATSYVPKKVTEAAKIPALGQKGPFLMACEIDAKPAGIIGFLRVWSANTRIEGKAGVDAFLATVKGVTKVETREVGVGGVTAVEATYSTPDLLEDGKERLQRLLVVPLAKGTQVLDPGGINSNEYKEMLPAYLLARQSLTPKA